jgi:hypothetical protein
LYTTNTIVGFSIFLHSCGVIVKKKFKLINIMPHILAAVTVIIVVIACGDGDIINPDKDMKIRREIEVSRDEFSMDELVRIVDSLAEERQKSSGVELPSSGIVVGESSTSEGTSSGIDVSSSATEDVSSSSEELPSSSSAAVSSSSFSTEASSSSSSTEASSSSSSSEGEVSSSSDEAVSSSSDEAVSSSSDEAVSSSSSSSVSYTCDGFICSFAKANYTHGENIPAPTITCSCGALDKTAANFSASSGAVPTDVNNWRSSSGNAYYGGSTDTLTPNAITVSNVKCGGVTVTGTKSCGSITVKRPTCTAPPGVPAGSNNYMLDLYSSNGGNVMVPPPTYSCGGASASSAKFSITDANSSNVGNPDNNPWNTTYNDNQYGNPATGRIIRMYEVSCDGHPLKYGTSYTDTDANILCGSINIIGRPTCVFNPSSYKTGDNVPAPTITCLDGSTPSVGNATFTTTGTAGQPANIDAWKTGGSTTYSSTGSSTVNVLGITCAAGTTVRATACTPNLTITAPP